MIQSVGFIWKFILKQKNILALGVFITGSVSFLTWLGPKLIERIIDQGIVPHEYHLAFIGVAMLAGAEFLRLLSIFLSQVVYSYLGQNVIEGVRAKMVQHLLSLNISFFDGVSSGQMMTRVVSDTNALSDFFQSGFVSVLGNVASVIAIFVGLFNLNFKLGFVLLIAFLPIVYACSIFSKRLRWVYEHSRTQLSNLNSMLADFLFGMRTIRSLGAGPAKFRELDAQIQKYANAQMQMVKTFALFQPTLSLGTGVLLIILIKMGIPLIDSNAMKVGEWVAALSYVILLQQPLTEISDRWNFFLAGLTSVDRIREVFQEQPEKVNSASPGRFVEIQMNGIKFKYPEAKTFALNGVSLKVKRGDWIGFYGESGSGKSTLLQMIYGFYSPEKGELNWNGKSYEDLDLKKIRSHFGVVEQFPFLFSGTIEDNLTLFGEHDLDMPALKSKFKGFILIESLLAQPKLEVNERGNNLSMGQKQMIAFLRAYLANPDIWILDEATAFFDQEAEEEVMRALENLGSEITVIQVAHRLEALQQMKQTIRVDSGCLYSTSSPN